MVVHLFTKINMYLANYSKIQLLKTKCTVFIKKTLQMQYLKDQNTNTLSMNLWTTEQSDCDVVWCVIFHFISSIQIGLRLKAMEFLEPPCML